MGELQLKQIEEYVEKLNEFTKERHLVSLIDYLVDIGKLDIKTKVYFEFSDSGEELE